MRGVARWGTGVTGRPAQTAGARGTGRPVHGATGCDRLMEGRDGWRTTRSVHGARGEQFYKARYNNFTIPDDA
jgi:hypothetical protein